MDAWLELVVRQIILYSLPMLVSLTVAGWAAARSAGRELPHPFHPIAWMGAWLPALAAIAVHRGLIVAFPRRLAPGPGAAAAAFAAHLALAGAGFGLYAWALHTAAPEGVPPLHLWWAKVLMFFNLCTAAMHLVPLPGQLAGELLARHSGMIRLDAWLGEHRTAWVWTLLAASPLLDAVLGAWLVFPVYGQLATWAARLAH